MMKKICMLSLLFFLLLTAVAYAPDEEVEEEDEFEEFASEALHEIESEGEAFKEAFETAGGTIPDLFRSAYAAFDPGYCGEEWMGSRGEKWLVVGTFLAPTLIVAMIIFFAIAVLYMGGQFLQAPKLIAIAAKIIHNKPI